MKFKRSDVYYGTRNQSVESKDVSESAFIRWSNPEDRILSDLYYLCDSRCNNGIAHEFPNR